MRVIIGNETEGTTVRMTPKSKPSWIITIHAGLFWKNFKFKVFALRWFTAVDRAILAWKKQNKRVPKRLIITIKKEM